MINDGGTQSGAATQTLGRYQLIRMIGHGGMGEVWLGSDPRLQRQVAIKTLPPTNRDDQEFAARFEREAQALAALNHPHILPVHDYGHQSLPNGRVITYIVMPYVSGGSLADRIKEHNNRHVLMPLQGIFAHLAQAAEAIDYAHEQGLIHRDIKPANMLLRNDNWLLLADFGIARILSGSGQLTQTGVGIGTPEYMAPEQAHGKAVPASDNYSLAVLAYQFFTGRVPFKADTGYATTIQHMTLSPPPPRQINPAISMATERILLQGLEKDPARRPPSNKAFVAALQDSINAPAYHLANEPTYLPPEANTAFGTTPANPQAQWATSVNHQQTTLANTKGMEAMDQLAPYNRQTPAPAQSQSAGSRPPAFSRRNLMLGGGVAALVVVGGGLGAWALSSQQKPKTPPPPGKASTILPAAAPPAAADAPYLTLQAHTQKVTSLVWQPKQHTLTSIGDDELVMLWDIDKLQPQQQSFSPAVKQKVPGGNMLLAWSPDGSMLALGNAYGTSYNFTSCPLFMFNAGLSNILSGFPVTVTGTNLINGLFWVQNKYVATITEPDGFIDKQQVQLSVWDATAPATKILPIAVNVGTLPLSGSPQSFATSPDDTQVAICTNNGIVLGQPQITGTTLTWKASTKSALTFSTNKYADSEVDIVAWSPGGGTVAGLATKSSPGSTLSGWSWQTNASQSEPLVSPGANMQLSTMAYCPATSSTLVAAGSQSGGTIYIWDVSKNHTPIRTLNSRGIKESVTNLTWSSDGVWLAASYADNYNSILLWKMQS